MWSEVCDLFKEDNIPEHINKRGIKSMNNIIVDIIVICFLLMVGIVATYEYF